MVVTIRTQSVAASARGGADRAIAGRPAAREPAASQHPSRRRKADMSMEHTLTNEE